MKQNNKASIVIIILVSIVLGGALGAVMQRGFDSSSINIGKKMKPLLEKISSPIVATITAYGTVESIDKTNKVITLNNQNFSFPIKISNTATIYIFDKGRGVPVQEPAGSINKVGLGDNLNINFKVDPDGSVIGQAVIILSKNPLTTK